MPKRPKPSTRPTREKFLMVRVTEEEHSELMQVAESLGISLSAWARSTLRREARKEQGR